LAFVADNRSNVAAGMLGSAAMKASGLHQQMPPLPREHFKEKHPMEGSNTRTFPRMLLDKPVEVQIGGDTIRVENPTNNLSVGGLFLHRSGLPVGAAVRVRISSPKPFEAEGLIFNCGNGEVGAGIGFDSLSGGNREALNDLIEDLTLRGLPAA
jgi:hypothetical protein